LQLFLLFFGLSDVQGGAHTHHLIILVLAFRHGLLFPRILSFLELFHFARNKKKEVAIIKTKMVGHRVKIHKITAATGKERGDLEIKDHVVLQKSQEQADRLPPPRTIILDFTLTHTRYDSSHVHTTGQMTNTRRSDGAPELDGVLREVSRKKILHYHQLYINRPDPIVFLPVAVDTTGRLYDDFSRLLFLHTHREASVLTNEIPEESDQFRFLRVVCYANIKGSVG
jgi:hypothetical protein